MKLTNKIICFALLSVLLVGCAKEDKKIDFSKYDNHELIVRYSELLNDNKDIRGLIQENLVSNQYTYEYDSHENDMNKLSVSDKDKGLLANLGESSTCQNIVYDNGNSISCNQEMSINKIEAIIPDFPEKEIILNEINKLKTDVKFSYSLSESMTHKVYIEITAEGTEEELLSTFEVILKNLVKYENIKVEDKNIIIDTNEIDMNIALANNQLIYSVTLTMLP